MLYSAFTEFSGFRVNADEYKLMGLSPYGNDIYKDIILNNLIIVNDDGTFSELIPTSIGGQWAKDGIYTIIANYFSSEPATTQFEYGGMVYAGVKDCLLYTSPSPRD